jgi:hypothetical protein
MKLIDERTPDGSRYFARLTHNTKLLAVRDHALLLRDAKVMNFVAEAVTRPWFDFTFRGHRFSIHSNNGELLLYVRDPQCSDLVLFEVGRHFEEICKGHK